MVFFMSNENPPPFLPENPSPPPKNSSSSPELKDFMKKLKIQEVYDIFRDNFKNFLVSINKIY
jgi:hypothetical protein